MNRLLASLTIPKLLLIYLLLIAPSFFAPFYSDDFFHLLLLSDNPLLQRNMPGSFLGLFAFVDDSAANLAQMRQYSVVPWWADAEFHFRFWRPLAELSHMFDYALLPMNAAFAHGHSIVLFMLVSAVFYKLSLALQPQHKILALLAFAIFLLDGQHVASISWVANRNALLAALFVLLCLYCYQRSVNRSSWPQYILSLLCLPLALLSSEAGLAATALLFAYAVCYEKLSFRNLLLKLSPFAAIVLLWVFFHQSMGYGAEPSGNYYVNPISHPLMFLLRLAERLPVYFFSALSSSPAGAYWTVDGWLPGFKMAYYLVAIISCSGFLFFLKPYLRQSQFLRFSLLAALLSALPACLANPQDRLSIMQSVGFAWFFAALILLLLGKGQRKLAALLLILQLLISPLHLFIGSVYMNMEARHINQSLLQFDEQLPIADKNIVLLNLPIGYSVMFTGVRAMHNKPLPRTILSVGNDAGELRIEKSSASSLRIERDVAFATGFEDAFRGSESAAFYVGQIIEHPLANIRIDAVDANHMPRVIVLLFATADALNTTQFYRWQQGAIQQVSLPMLLVE